MIKYILIALLTLFLCVPKMYAQKGEKKDPPTQLSKDGNITYPKKILVNPDFDFKLKGTEKGKFLLSFYKSQTKAVTIKIYDLTGNLVLQESVSEEGSFSKEYDLSYYKPNFFVVEVGSSQYNKTKSIIAQ